MVIIAFPSVLCLVYVLIYNFCYFCVCVMVMLGSEYTGAEFRRSADGYTSNDGFPADDASV